MSKSPKVGTPAHTQRVIENAQKLRHLATVPGWAVLSSMLQGAIESARERLTQEDCSWDETRVLRNTLPLMRRLLALPNITDEQLAKLEQDLAFQQEREKIRESVGLTSSRKEQP